jgi:histidinol-phosphate aminotransferase
VIQPTPAIAAIPASTPFIGPEQLMRETGRHELVRLGANESAFGPSPKAIAAMAAQLERLSWYGDPDSLDLRDALAAKHACSPSQVLVGAGIDDLMGLAVRAFAGDGGGAVVTRGTYPTFMYHVTGYGARPLYLSYMADGSTDLDAMLALARSESPRIIYLANPDNPSGRFIARADMERFYASLPADTLLLLDEAYADFVDERELMPPLFEDRLLRLRTFSKAYGMAGARIGYALGTPEVLATLGKVRLQYGVNRNAQIGALASLHDELFRRFVVAQTADGRNDYYRLARELGAAHIPSHTNFVCIDMGNAQRAVSVMKELLALGVWVRKPGAPPLDRFIRVSIGTAPMRDAFARALRAVLAGAVT